MSDFEHEQIPVGSGFPWPGSLRQQVNWIAHEVRRSRANAARLQKQGTTVPQDQTLRLMNGELIHAVPIPGMPGLIKSALWAQRHWVNGVSNWCPEHSVPALLPRERCAACGAGIKLNNLTVWVPVLLHSTYDFENRRWGISQGYGAWLLPLIAATYAKNSEALNRGDCIWSADRASGYGIKVERRGSYGWTKRGLREALARFPVPVLRLDREALNAIGDRRTPEPANGGAREGKAKDFTQPPQGSLGP
jgi:hypothetical protein